MPRSLTNYQIKLLAALFMVIDHIGAVLLPDVAELRIIGRLSFPLFCWLLVQGEAHTRNVYRYGRRLLLWGIISQPIYQLTFELAWWEDFNILFTLLIGLVCLRSARASPDLELPIWLAGGLVAEVIRVNYGIYGIALIALIAHFKPNQLWWTAWIALHLLTLVAWGDQVVAGASPIFFLLANHQPGAKARWFYLFYPGHLLMLFGVKSYGLPGVSGAIAGWLF
jgi:hypothetical protein